MNKDAVTGMDKKGENMMECGFCVDLPQIADKEFYITDYGAVVGGKVSNTGAFAAAIGAAGVRGGRVVVPAGIWLTGPIELLSGVELHLQDNAVLLFDKNKEEYPLIVTDYEGIRRIRTVSPISARGQQDIAITGTGVIDGNGHLWRPVKQFKTTERQWQALLAKSPHVIDSNEGGVWVPEESIYKARFRGEIFPGDYDTEEEALQEAAAYYDFYRPVLMSIQHCNRVLIEGVTLRNSPAWMVHPYFCENVTVRGITLVNPAYAQNGDGLDVDSCKNVEIHHSTFMTGDDAICVKAGKDREARKLKKSSENIHIHDCTVMHSPSGFVIGSEMSRGVRNVLVEDCSCTGDVGGVYIHGLAGRPDTVHDITIRNCDFTKEGTIDLQDCTKIDIT